MPLDPEIELVRLPLLLLGELLGAPAERLYAQHHGAQEVGHAADDGEAQNGIAVLDQADGVDLGDQRAVGFPADYRLPLGAPHEDALHQSLSANAGAERAGIHFMIVCHCVFCSLLSHMGSVTVTSSPPPSAL